MIQLLTPEFLNRVIGHASVWGRSQVGKSMFLEAWALALIKQGVVGVTFADHHGSARRLYERVANPENGCSARTSIFIDFAGEYTCGLSPTDVYDDSLQAAHEAALLWTSTLTSTYGAQMHQTPLLETINYTLALFASAKGLTLVELLPAISLAGGAIREFLLANFEHLDVAMVLADLHELARRNPRAFLEQIYSTRNRLQRWMGDRRLRRLLGRRNGLDALAVMDGRINVFIDSSSLPEADADFVHTLLQCRYFAAAKRRPPHGGARHRLFIDEAHGSFCDASARMLDQTLKFGLAGTYSLHRITQVIEKGEFVAGALLSHTTPFIFQMKDPEGARLLAETAHTGHLNLEEYKEASTRAVAVGNEVVRVQSRTRSEHRAHSRSHADITASSYARASAAMSANMFSASSSLGSGENLSIASMPATPLSSGTPISKHAGRNNASQTSRARGASSGRSFATQYARSRAHADAEADVEGVSEAVGEAEQHVTKWALMPTQMWSLDEQLHRAIAQITTLAARHCIVKLDNAPPLLARTPDLPEQPFKSAEFRAQWLPRFIENAARASSWLVRNEFVDDEIAERRRRITQMTSASAPDADFAAREPLPTIIDDPHAYADEFRRRNPGTARASLRVVGGKDGDKSGDE